MMSVIQLFFEGCLLPIRALILLFRTPSLWIWAILPSFFTGLVYFFAFKAMLLGLQPLLPSWLTYSLGGLALLVGVFFFSTASTLIAGPFYDWLSEKTENLPSVSLPAVPPNQKGWLAAFRHLGIDFTKSALSLVGYAFCLSISWIPLINIFGGAISLGLISYQFVSYAQTRRGMGPKTAAQLLVRHWPLAVGMGLTLALPLSIPVLSILTLPLATISGALLAQKISLRLR